MGEKSQSKEGPLLDLKRMQVGIQGNKIIFPSFFLLLFLFFSLYICAFKTHLVFELLTKLKDSFYFLIFIVPNMVPSATSCH